MRVDAPFVFPLVLARSILPVNFPYIFFKAGWFGGVPPEAGVLAVFSFGPGLPVFALFLSLCSIAPPLGFIWRSPTFSLWSLNRGSNGLFFSLLRLCLLLIFFLTDRCFQVPTPALLFSRSLQLIRSAFFSLPPARIFLAPPCFGLPAAHPPPAAAAVTGPEFGSAPATFCFFESKFSAGPSRLPPEASSSFAVHPFAGFFRLTRSFLRRKAKILFPAPFFGSATLVADNGQRAEHVSFRFVDTFPP